MLDVFTLLVVLVVIHLLTTGVLCIMLYIHKDIPGLKNWAIGRILVTGALILFALRPHLALPISTVGGNALLFLGSYSIWVGMRHFVGAPQRKHLPYLIGVLAFMAGTLFYTVHTNSLMHRAILTAAFAILYSGMLLRVLLIYNRNRYMTVKLFQVTALLHLAFNAAWAAGIPFILNSNNLLDQNLAFQLFFFEAIVLSALTACTFIAMTAEHLHLDMRNQAEYDVLTNTINRRAFYPLAEHTLARRAREFCPVSLMMMDLDHFKNINDTYGHPVGDEVLRQVSATIRMALRTQDVLCRFGGEEFIVLCPNTHSEAANQIAERIRSAVELLEIRVQDQDLSVTISIGYATYASNSKLNELETLIQAADVALYAAKDNGRNQSARGYPQSIVTATNVTAEPETSPATS